MGFKLAALATVIWERPLYRVAAKFFPGMVHSPSSVAGGGAGPCARAPVAPLAASSAPGSNAAMTASVRSGLPSPR